MRKYLLIPDSFKGNISSSRVCAIMARAIREYDLDANIISIPVADGGEGSVDTFLASVGGEKYRIAVKGPFSNNVPSFFGILSDCETAVIEMAASSGLSLVGDRLEPKKTTTYGAGQLMEKAIDIGCSRIIMALGDSATNDGGCGAAAAMGARFFDKNGTEFLPTGGTLKDIERIDVEKLRHNIQSVSITAMCDIRNPLYGENGAAYIFGPQKGADERTVKELDDGLRHLDEVVKRELGLSLADKPGAGAAGGMGYGMMTFFDATLRMGIEIVLDTVRFSDMLENTDFVFTGEGRIDSQSLLGKVVIGVARRAKKNNTPVIAFVGDIGDDIDAAYDEGVSAIFSTNRIAAPLKTLMPRAERDLYLTVDNFMRLLNRVSPPIGG